MLRHLVIACLLGPAFLVPGTASAQDRPVYSISEGTHVRIYSRSLGLLDVQGTVEVAGSRGLVVDLDREGRTPVPLPEVDRIELRRHHGRATGLGAAVGAGLGAMAGAYSAVAKDIYAPGTDYSSIGLSILAGTALGLVAGGVVGSLIKTETWTPIFWYDPYDDYVYGTAGIGVDVAFDTDE